MVRGHAYGSADGDGVLFVSVSWLKMKQMTDKAAVLIRIAAFCEQTASDGILPSLAWFAETAAGLREVADVLDEQTMQKETSDGKRT